MCAMPSRRIAALALTLAVAMPIAAQAKDGPAEAPPAAHTFQLGALRPVVVRGGGWRAFNDGTVFGLNATRPEVTALLAKAGAPTDAVTLDVDALLVRLPGHVVLIDAGLGPADHEVILQSLAIAGVKPADVTDVLVTHGHTDHVGGLVDADNKPAFPNAIVRMSTREWASLQSDRWQTTLAKAIAPQVRVFEPGAELLPGITPIALYGHTPGHVGYVLVSGDARLVDIGDLAHSAIISLGKPGWTIDFDQDRDAGARTRQDELARLAADHTLIFAPHFPFPGIGRIAPAGDGYAWAPAEP